MKFRRAVWAAAVAGSALAPLSARAEGTPIVAAPGSYLATYATPVVVATAGASLTFVNTDIQPHDVVSDDTRAPGTADWCPAGGPRCPLFFADLIGIGGSTEVKGLHDIAPGIYVFRCSPHSWMEATLVVA